MDLDEALVRLRDEGADVADRKKVLMAQVSELDSELEVLNSQIAALEQVVARVGGAPVNEWLVLNRQDAAERVLRELGGPDHLDSIVAHLQGHGRDDTKALVSAALSVLKRKGRVINRGQGIWALPEHVSGLLLSPGGVHPDGLRLQRPLSANGEGAAS